MGLPRQVIEELAGPLPTLGPGISRPREGERTKKFTVLVRFSREKPMRVVLRAPNKNAAKRYARSRWPHAIDVEVL